MSATVTPDKLESELAKLDRGQPTSHGVFGPGSGMWELNREAIVFAGGGRAALLQLAHPAVAAAVDQHSATRDEMLGRFVRTFDNVFAMVFGPLDRALESARRVHKIHQTIVGEIGEDVGPFKKNTRYRANEPDYLLWVFATLADTSLQVCELAYGPLPERVRHAYYEDSKNFARLFGLGDETVPKDLPAFEAYMARMLGPGSPVVVSRAGREMGQFLMRAPRPSLGPFFAFVKVVTTGLLPERLREEFGLPHGPANQRAFELAMSSMRLARKAAPGTLRFLPVYNQAVARIASREPSFVQRSLLRGWDRLRESFRKPRRGRRARYA